MNKMLAEVAEQLRGTHKKVQLIYAFNGTGKTRLSREFKQLVAPKEWDGGEGFTDMPTPPRTKILYYSAFTEDLFYWDNDLDADAEPKLRIQPNTFTDWVLKDQGQDGNVITTFQRYANDKLTPHFDEKFSAITFSLESGDDERAVDLKISKGEESNFIWSVFFTLLEQAIATLNDVEPDFPEPTPFDDLKYVFIDDPVSSLDDSHLIQLAVDLAALIKADRSDIKFIITTHNPLFFNVLFNEFVKDQKTEGYHWKARDFHRYLFEKNEDGSHCLKDQPNDSPFAYQLHLMALLQNAISTGQVEKYHFNLLRNILEKTATFLGHKRWELLLPEAADGIPSPYEKRLLNFSSHSKHAAEEVQPLKPEEKAVLAKVVNHLIENYHFSKESFN